MNKTNAVEVSIHAVSPLLTSARAGDDRKLKKVISNDFLKNWFTLPNKFCIYTPLKNDYTN
tara:strand:+ start:244 stop:426 length:183 start_codon:yes stop_codon:yes gene_type:complete